MREARAIAGEFWLPGQPSHRQRGILRIGPGAAPTVVTTVPLLSALREASRQQLPDGHTVIVSYLATDGPVTPVTVHGQDRAGRPLTLLDAVTFDGQHFHGLLAIVGGHALDRDHHFVGFRVRLAHLSAWSAYAQEVGWARGTTLASGGQLTLEVHDASDSNQPAAWLCGRGLPPTSFRVLESRFVRPLMTIFSLATDRRCDVLDRQLQADATGDSWWDVYSSAQVTDRDDSDDRWDIPRWLLQPADLEAHHLSTWLNQAELLGPRPKF
jgi:hypothetical protein